MKAAHEQETTAFIAWFRRGHPSGDAQVASVGSKGANLITMHRAGLNVPPGFCVTTDAYRAAVAPIAEDIIHEATELSRCTRADPEAGSPPRRARRRRRGLPGAGIAGCGGTFISDNGRFGQCEFRGAAGYLSRCAGRRLSCRCPKAVLGFTLDGSGDSIPHRSRVLPRIGGTCRGGAGNGCCRRGGRLIYGRSYLWHDGSDARQCLLRSWRVRRRRPCQPGYIYAGLAGARRRDDHRG